MQSFFLLSTLSLAVAFTLTLANAHGGHGSRRNHARRRPSGRPSPSPSFRPRPTFIPGINWPHPRFPTGRRPSRVHYTRPKLTHHFKTGEFMKSKDVLFRLEFEITNKNLDRKFKKEKKYLIPKIEKQFQAWNPNTVKEVHLKDFKKGKKGVICGLLFAFPSLPTYGNHKWISASAKANFLKQKLKANILRQNGILVDGVRVDPNSIMVKPYKGNKPGKKKRFFNGVLRLLMKWTNSYSDKRSANHKRLVQKFYKAMKNVFPKENELIHMKVKSLRKGSVIVNFELALSLSGSAKDVQTKMEEKIRNGRFSDMKVDKWSLKINEIEPAKHQAHVKGKHHLSYEVKSAIIVLALVLVCLCIGIGTWYYVKGRHSRKERDRVQEFDNPIKFPNASVA